MMKIWGRMQSRFQVLGRRLSYRHPVTESRAMRYKDPYTGMGYFACLLINKPPSRKSEYLLEMIDLSGRQWLCCDMGKPAMEAAAIVTIYDSIVREFAETMGKSIEGDVLSRAPEEQEKWGKWYGQVLFVNTPSVEALAGILAQKKVQNSSSGPTAL